MFDATQTSRPASSTEAGATPHDSVLYIKVVDGDSDTYPDWEAAYLDNIDRIYRLAYTGVGNQPDSEELTAEVFKAALGRLRLNSPKEEVRDESSEPDDWEVRRNSNPVISDLRLLKYMSDRDATLAAGVSQGSGNALQYRALFVAANLAEGYR
jgi:RNA polymerase sigma-70 factor (ECF subfamily)